MTEEDDSALKMFAEAFEEYPLTMLDCIFWEDVRYKETGMR